MWAFVSSRILRNRLTLLLSLGGITAFMAYKAGHVELSYEFARVLPYDNKDYLDYENFKKLFGEDGSVLMVGIQDSDIFEINKFTGWYELGNKIKNIDGIEEVVSVARIYTIVKNDSLEKFEFRPLVSRKPSSQAETDSLKETILSLPFYEGLLYNRETGATLMAITLDKQKLNSRNRIALVDSIKSSCDRFGVTHHLDIHYSGLPYIRTAISRKVADEMILFLGLAVAVTAVILFSFFRSFKIVFFSLLIVTVGVIWSVGLIVLLGYKITILTGLIPPLIIVIGVPNSILLLNKYHSEYKKHGNKIRALSRMIEKISVTTFLANLTTAIGFGVFYFTRSQILMEFGLVAAANVMATYLISLVLIPIVFSYLPDPSVRHTKHLKGKFISFFLRKVDYWVHHHRPAIYLTVGVLIAISLVGVRKLRSVGFIVDDLPEKDPIYADMKFFERSFQGVMPFEILIDTKKEGGVFADNAATLYKIKSLQKILSSYPEFSKSLSVADAIRFSYQAYRDGSRKYFILPPPTELEKIRPYVQNSGTQAKRPGAFHSFIDSTKQRTRVSAQMADIGSVKMKQLINGLRLRIDSIFDPSAYNVTITGNSRIFLQGNDYLLVNLKESIILAIILIAIVMFTLFMSARMILASMLPSLIPLLITAGVMGYFHIALKPSTILIFSIAFGIASDGTIYFLTKYRQELKNHHWSISRTVSMAIAETGVSMVYTAVILFCGFAIFTASGFGGTVALGILVSFTLLVAYCSNLILLPTILLSMEKRLTTRAFLKEPLIQVYDEEEDIEPGKLEIIGKDKTTVET